MKPVFADTSFYVALVHRDDTHHEDAIAWSQDNTRRFVLTEFVLLELGNTLSPRGARDLFVDMVHHLRADPANRIIPASHALFAEGFALFERRPDKEWSLTDCISFLVMKRERITDALTVDAHFSQAGFTVLLR